MHMIILFLSILSTTFVYCSNDSKPVQLAIVRDEQSDSRPHRLNVLPLAPAPQAQRARNINRNCCGAFIPCCGMLSIGLVIGAIYLTGHANQSSQAPELFNNSSSTGMAFNNTAASFFKED